MMGEKKSLTEDLVHDVTDDPDAPAEGGPAHPQTTDAEPDVEDRTGPTAPG